jgi:predicted transcriptional regulator
MNPGSFYFDIAGHDLTVFLGPTESRLMELAWSHTAGLTVKRAIVLLESDPAPVYTTVMTVMNRLVEKGLLSRERDGKHFVYRASISREEYVRERLRAIIGCLEQNFPGPLKDLAP